MGGGSLPSGAGFAAPFLSRPQSVATGQPNGCYTWNKGGSGSVSPGGAHACTLDGARSTGRFEGAQSLAGFRDPSDPAKLLDFFVDSYINALIPGNKVPFLYVRVHAVFRAPRLGNQNFLVDGVARVDQTFLLPVEPSPQYCQNPVWPLNFVGLLSYVRFTGELPMFGKTQGIAEMCVLYQVNPPF